MGKYMSEFLDNLVQDIKVDIKTEEMNDIQCAVDELLERMLLRVEQQNPHFKSRKIVPCGSMAENTRIWRFSRDNKSAIMEFDFLAILEKFSHGSFKTTDSCGGFMEVNDVTKHLPAEYINEDNATGTVGRISAKRLSFNYRLQMMKSVSSLCNCYEFETESRIVKGCEIVTFGNVTKTKVYKNECQRCKISKNTGTLVFATGATYHPVELNCTVAFLWERKAEMYSETPCVLSRQEPIIKQEFIILIDFLPAIEVLGSNPEILEKKSEARYEFSSRNTTKQAITEQKSDKRRIQSSRNNTNHDTFEKGFEMRPKLSIGKNTNPGISENHPDKVPVSSCKNTTSAKDDTPRRHVCFLVPKVCKGDHDTCWKISHCRFEMHLLKTTTQVHRDCYMALKFLLDYIVSDMSNLPGTPTTYILKTALLYHIQKCSAETPNMTKCLSGIVEFLSDAHKHALLPHFILNTLNLLATGTVEKDFEFHQEYITWSKSRNVLLGKCWKVLFNVLENLELVLPSGFDFDKVQTALKFSTIIYGRAYIETNFKVLHEPNDEELFTVVCRICKDEYVSREEVDRVIKVKGDIESLWERKLLYRQYGSATKLYSSMLYEIPRFLLEERHTQLQPSIEETEIIYSRVAK